MTDNFGPLRQAMSDLAEHGGSTDMYERSLRKSRQSQRRTAFAAGAAAVAVVFAIGAAVGVAAAKQPGPSTPAATPSASASGAAPTSAAPSVTPTSAAPHPTRPSSTPPSSTRTSNRPRYPDCPSAKTLERLLDLPKDTHLVPSSVECWRTWADAAAKGPIPGDGIYLFQYKAGTGWRFHSEGSGYHCKDLGITSGNPPFCYMD